MALVFIGIGSNLGDRKRMLEQACGAISKLSEVPLRVSRVYETEPVGFVSKNKFLNGCLCMETSLPAEKLMLKLQKTEEEMGRQRRSGECTDRVIDIDLLLYGRETIATKEMVIPHPRMHLRRFVLQPLSEIAGDFHHPVLGKTILELLNVCEDRSEVTIYKI